MKGNNPLPLLLCLSLFPLCLPAQELVEVLFGKNSKVSYMGQYNYNGKRKNGFGIERYKDGSIYVGDFSEDKITGRGMYIAGKKGIANLEGAAVYVGKWRDGKKSGKGTCYDSTGNLVYEGTFAGDKPVTTGNGNSSTGNPGDKRFAILEMGEELYLGEVTNGTPHGFGLKLQEDGSLFYGNVKDGHPTGICMTIYTPDAWEVGQWSDGTYRAFNNSNVANANREAFRNSSKTFKRQMWSDIMVAAENFTMAAVSTANMAQEIKNGGSSSANISVGDAAPDNIPSGKSKSFYQTEYNKWERKAKNTFEDRVRHKVTAKTAGDGRVATSDAKLLRSYQKMMRQIRQTAAKEGHILIQSTYETASF